MTNKTTSRTKGHHDISGRPSCQADTADRETTQRSNFAEDAVLAVAVTVPLVVVCMALIIWLR